MIDMQYAEEEKPSSVDIVSGLGDNRSVTSEITFQSATRGLSVEHLLQMVDKSNADHVGGGGLATRIHTEPPPKPSNNDHIDTIIELKLQVAQQKEMIDSLTSDLNHALSEQKAIPSKANQPAEAAFTLTSLTEEKAHSDKWSLYKQYNDLRDENCRLKKSLHRQQEKLDAVEADNISLTKERNRLQRQIAGMSFKLDESNASASQDFTANLTDFSGLSELILPADDQIYSDYQPKRAIAKGQSHVKLEHKSFLSRSEVKRRSSEPAANSQGQQDKPAPGDSDVPKVKEDKRQWFVRDDSESSLLSKMIVYWNKGTNSVEEQEEVKQVPHRRSSMHDHDKVTPTIKPSHQPRRMDAVVDESYRNSLQSEQFAGSFNSIVWGDADTVSNSEM